MAITREITEPYFNGGELNSTFVWSTTGYDTCIVSNVTVSGTPDTDPTDPQFTIEESHDLNGAWRALPSGATTMNQNTQTAELTVTAPWMRVRTSTANSTAFRSSIVVSLRNESVEARSTGNGI
ncbi:MAG: hypothetical protein IID39_05145 [Planctomycetes bacterium]|nr:hypothetical protein [Planctomycetota bacterium]